MGFANLAYEMEGINHLATIDTTRDLCMVKMYIALKPRNYLQVVRRVEDCSGWHRQFQSKIMDA
jgi:hypothetical protein